MTAHTMSAREALALVSRPVEAFEAEDFERAMSILRARIEASEARERQFTLNAAGYEKMGAITDEAQALERARELERGE